MMALVCRNLFTKLGDNAYISKPYKELLSAPNYEFIDQAITQIAKHKHGKVEEEKIDHFRLIQIFMTISSDVFSNNSFGFFERVQKQKFKQAFEGIFRQAVGTSPFHECFRYTGNVSFSDGEAFIINQETKRALALQPLLFWDECTEHTGITHCYLFDGAEKDDGIFSFKAVGFKCSSIVSITNEYKSVAENLIELQKKDVLTSKPIEGVEIAKIDI